MWLHKKTVSPDRVQEPSSNIHVRKMEMLEIKRSLYYLRE